MKRFTCFLFLKTHTMTSVHDTTMHRKFKMLLRQRFTTLVTALSVRSGDVPRSSEQFCHNSECQTHAKLAVQIMRYRRQGGKEDEAAGKRDEAEGKEAARSPVHKRQRRASAAAAATAGAAATTTATSGRRVQTVGF